MISANQVGPNVLSAGASFVNPEQLGQAIGSGSSQGVNLTTDEETGLEVELSLNKLIELINQTQSQSWYQRLTEFLEKLASISPDPEIIESLNNIVEEDGVFFDILGIYDSTTLELVGPAIIGEPSEDEEPEEGEEEVVIEEERKYKSSLQLLHFWIAETVVGTSEVENNIITSITGEVERFSAALSVSEAYLQQNNQFIDSVSSLNESEASFTDMNDWTTSGVSSITLATRDFGEDLEKTGNLLNFSEYQNLGNPGQFINQLSQAGGLVVIIERLQESGVNIQSAIERQSAVSAVESKRIYDTLLEITGQELEDLKSVLRLRTENINTAADLLDPKKIFPNSYFTLKSPIFGETIEFKPIYSDRSGSISQDFNQLGGTLRSVMPVDIAAANAALAISLGQITNISSVSVPEFAAQIKELETLKDVEDIEGKTELVDQETEDVWLDADIPIPLGTGPNNRLLLADLIGLASGYNIVAPLQQNLELFSELESSGALDSFTASGSPSDPNIGLFEIMENVLDGTYTTTTEGGDVTTIIPSGVKGEGTYTGSTEQETIISAWFSGVYPELIAASQEIVANNPELAESIMRNSSRWQAQLARETTNRSRLLEPNFYNLPHSRQDSLQFAQQLPRWGSNTTIGGAAQILEGITDRSTKGGQSLIAAMREGRNVDRLESVGISTRAPRPLPEGEKINLSGSQISAEEAQSRL